MNPVRRRVLGVLEANDIGLTRFRTAFHVLIAVSGALVIGAILGPALGLPSIEGMMLAALPAFLCCLSVSDERASLEALRSAALIVPIVGGMLLSAELRDFRLVELTLLVVILVAQFYVVPFGVWAVDAASGLFAAFVSGLLLPLPSGAALPLTLIVTSSLAFTILLRLTVLRPNARRALLRARRGFLGLTRRVLAASLERIEQHDPTRHPRLDRRLERLIRRMEAAALLADGLISKTGSGATGELARALNRVLFDAQLAVETIARNAAAASRSDPATRAFAATSVRQVLSHGLHDDDAGTRQLHAQFPASPDGGDQEVARRIAGAIDWLAAISSEWNSLRAHPPASSEIPFASTVSITGGRVQGAATVFEDTLAGEGMDGRWHRVKLSPATRTAIQGLVAVAIAEPLGLLIGGDRFYWAVVGVLVVLVGTNSVHERVRKAGRRLIGTALGGAIGIPLALVAGATRPGVALVIILACLTSGVYMIAVRYWAWVTALVVLLCQVYALSGQFDETIVPLRLAENGLGVVVAVVVSAVILPVGGSSIRRTAVRLALESIGDFAAALDPRAAEPVSDFRPVARQIDLRVHHLDAVFNPFGGISPSRSRHAEMIRVSMDRVSYIVGQIAAQPPAPHALSTPDEALLTVRTRALVDAIGSTARALSAGPGDRTLGTGDPDEAAPAAAAPGAVAAGPREAAADRGANHAPEQPWLQQRVILVDRVTEILTDLTRSFGRRRDEPAVGPSSS